MKTTFARFCLIAALIASLAGCGGGGGGGTTGGTGVVAFVGGDSSASSDHGVFDAYLTLGQSDPVVKIASPPQVNFAVLDASGKHVPGLKLSGATNCGGKNLEFIMGEFDTLADGWKSLITDAGQGVADPTLGTAKLTEHADKGYYHYEFSTNVGIAPEALDVAARYRIALGLCFVDPQTKATVKANPYFDFGLEKYTDDQGLSAARSVQVLNDDKQLSEYKKVADKALCNECHQSLAAHDDRFVDPNACVVCHSAGSKDTAQNKIDFKFMVHRLHRGGKKFSGVDPQAYPLNTAVAVSSINYPQELRNCVKCHDATRKSATGKVLMPQGDNWKTKASTNACLACHNMDSTSRWYSVHQVIAGVKENIDNPELVGDDVCAGCHGDGVTKIGTASVHAIPEWTKSASYQYTIHGDPIWNQQERTVSVDFSVSNPADGNAYNIKDIAHTYTTESAGTVTRNFVFGDLAVLVGWGSGDYTNAGAVAATSWTSSCTTAVPAGQSTCASDGLPPAVPGGNLVVRGQPVVVNATFDSVALAGNRFRVTSTPLPVSASGTGVVVLQGRVSLKKDAASSYSVPVTTAVKYFAIGGSGAVTPRRTVVTAAKCNACHGRYINEQAHTHLGSSTEPEACVVCHNGNNVLNGLDGKVSASPDSAHFKRMIHAKHKAQGANYPVMPSALNETSGNYSGLKKCTVCHDDSYKKDLGAMGSSTAVQVDSNGLVTDSDPSDNPVISPKAAACSSCHASETAKSHMIGVGGAAFGTVTQADIAAGRVSESCDSCHVSGGLAGVDTKHGL